MHAKNFSTCFRQGASRAAALVSSTCRLLGGRARVPSLGIVQLQQASMSSVYPGPFFFETLHDLNGCFRPNVSGSLGPGRTLRSECWAKDPSAWCTRQTSDI